MSGEPDVLAVQQAKETLESAQASNTHFRCEFFPTFRAVVLTLSVFLARSRARDLQAPAHGPGQGDPRHSRRSHRDRGEPGGARCCGEGAQTRDRRAEGDKPRGHYLLCRPASLASQTTSVAFLLVFNTAYPRELTGSICVSAGVPAIVCRGIRASRTQGDRQGGAAGVGATALPCTAPLTAGLLSSVQCSLALDFSAKLNGEP